MWKAKVAPHEQVKKCVKTEHYWVRDRLDPAHGGYWERARGGASDSHEGWGRCQRWGLCGNGCGGASQDQHSTKISPQRWSWPGPPRFLRSVVKRCILEDNTSYDSDDMSFQMQNCPIWQTGLLYLFCINVYLCYWATYTSAMSLTVSRAPQ